MAFAWQREATIALGILGLILPGPASAEGAERELQPEATVCAEQFHEGVQLLYDKMLERSPDPFLTFPRERFESEVERMLAREEPISEGEMFIELSRFIGMMRGGHSWIFLDRDTALFSRAVPLRVAEFSDGLFVRAAAPNHRDLVGGRILAINGVPIETAWPRIKDAVGEGPQIARERALVYTLMPDYLRALGMGDDAAISFTLKLTDGRRETRRIEAEQWPHYDELYSAALGFGTPEGWIVPEDARNAAWFRRHQDAFWYEYQPDSSTVYAQFNAATTDPDNPWNAERDALRPMLVEIFARVAEPDVDRLVIDLRNNRGGNSALWQPIVHHIIRSDKLQEPGRLFVIIGHATGSAAVAWAAQIEGNSRAVFVGEPTADRPNFHNDPDGPRRARFDVPKTALNFFVANQVEQWSSSDDHRAAIYPDIPVMLSWNEFATGHDPVMEAIMQVTPEEADAYFVDVDGDPILRRALWANYRRKSQYSDAQSGKPE